MQTVFARRLRHSEVFSLAIPRFLEKRFDWEFEGSSDVKIVRIVLI
jgi:hypothetical protein